MLLLLLVSLPVGAFSPPPRIIIHFVPFNAGTDLRLRDSGGQEGGKDKPDALLLTALPIQRVTCYQLSSCR